VQVDEGRFGHGRTILETRVDRTPAGLVPADVHRYRPGIAEGATYTADVAAEQRRFLSRVFAWMFLGLALTGGVAYWISRIDGAVEWMSSHTAVLIVLVVAQLACVVGLSFLVNKVNATVAAALFLLYSVLTGVLFSFIFEVYTSGSIARTFFITAGTFGAFAVWGWVTHADLSRFGSILFMALFGLIIATVVNLFLSSSTLYWVTTFAGILIFCGLTAYDMQKIKKMNEVGNEGTDADRKEAIVGALALYLDFINLFLFLLRIFGSARS
jgi:uncharacterized protein